MSKEAFLQSLERLLKSLKKDERKKFLSFYNEMIEDYMEDGMTEEDAVKHVGTPGSIAEEILSNREVAAPKSMSTGMKVVVILLLILGSPLWGSILLAGGLLALAAVMLVLCGYFLIWCIPLMTGSVCIGTLVLGIVSLAGSPLVMFNSASLGVTQIGMGIMCAGVCMLFGMITWCLGRVFIGVSARFSKWLLSLFRRKRGAKA